MSIEEFRRRANMQIEGGWSHIPGEVFVIYPEFDLDFDKFAASVAYQLRHQIVYRSDGGVFARGLVRATGDLAILHKEMRDAKIPVNQKVSMAAAMYRRKHSDPTSRYMMSVRFGRVAITEHESIEVNASAQVTAQSDANLGGRILDWAEQAGSEPSWDSERKKRIADWAKIARLLGYPRYLELWHYNRSIVAKFVQVQFENQREQMTGGRPAPYDGSWGTENWRVYPFKLIMAECKRKTNVDDCYAHAANQLKQSEGNVLAMINDVYKAMIKYGSAHSQDFRPGSVPGSADAKYRDLAPFLNDLKKQLNDINSLMQTYTQYTQYQPGVFDGY